MSITNNLKRQIDLPVWEWARFAPAVSSAISSSCAALNPEFNLAEHGRFIYYLISATAFYRYDTWTDTYFQLSNPPVAPLSFSSMKFQSSSGIEGRVLAAGTSTITIPGVFGQVLKGYDIVIVSGTGIGQRRTITAVADVVSADSGIMTGNTNTIGTLNITDSTKAWGINQWAGYTVRLTFGPGVGQVRRIISNSATVLTLSDVTNFPNVTFNNCAIFAPAPSVTAGTQTSYSIESQVLTVDSDWAVQPDTTSVFEVQTGSVFLVSSTAATPFFSFQQYDIITDTWYIRQTPTLTMVAGTDVALTLTDEICSIWERGIATGGTTTTLIDSSKNWTTDQWAGYYVRIYSGTGEDQMRPILSNTATTLTWSTSGTAPTETSRYMISGFDCGTATAGASTTITDSSKAWTTNRWKNYVVHIISGTGKGQKKQIASNTGTVITIIGTWDTTPDTSSNFQIMGDPDKLYVQLGGNSPILLANLSSDVQSFGRQEDFGAARNASARLAGGHFASAIASLSNATTTATVTTSHNHMFRVGQSVVVAGATDANFNGTFTIASVPSATTFTYTMGGTPAGTTLGGTQSTSTLRDTTKNWTTNQWAGYICYMTTTVATGASGVATGQALRVASNTATTLTFVTTGTAPVNGITKYCLTPTACVGSLDSGIATGTQSTTTLQDTSKTWVVNIHAGKRLKMTSGTGVTQDLAIASNTSNTLTFAAGTAPVTAVTTYAIMEQPARGTGIESKWIFGNSNLETRGKWIFTPRGGAAIGFDRLDITTDRITFFTTSPQMETLTTGSMFAYDLADRIFYHKDGTQRVMAFDVNTGRISGGSQYPYAAPTAVLGNRMEIIVTEDGLKYLWLNRASQTECFRTLVFW